MRDQSPGPSDSNRLETPASWHPVAELRRRGRSPDPAGSFWRNSAPARIGFPTTPDPAATRAQSPQLRTGNPLRYTPSNPAKNTETPRGRSAGSHGLAWAAPPAWVLRRPMPPRTAPPRLARQEIAQTRD